MKNISKYMFVALMGAGLVACSPETFDGMSEAGMPVISNYDGNINITVDQSINQVTFNLADAQGVYPIWTVNTGKKSETFTANDAKRIYTTAGDYEVTVQIGNRNGISEGKVTKIFHIDNSIVDFTPYITKLSKAPWFVDNTAKGHMGCGPSGTAGTEWWSADTDAKKAEGVYENSLTFTADMKYTFDPGKSGTIYVNNGCSIFPDYNNKVDDKGAAIDFTVPVEKQETTYALEMDGDDLYLVFPAHTLFPYIANDDIWNTPRYRVLNITTKAMELVIDNGSIAWHYLLTTSHEVVFEGFDATSADNVWNQAAPTFKSLYYAHGGGWEGYPDYEHSEENGTFTVKLPSASDMQWQAQYQLETSLNSTNVIPGTKYDFSCKIISNKDLPSVTVKLTSSTDDPSIVNNQSEPAKAIGGEATVIYFTECEAPTIEGNYKMVFDFGGNPEGTEITIKDICLIDHSKNTITPPSKDPEPGPAANVKDWNSSSAANLWKTVESGDDFISVTPWFSPSDWSGGLTPTWSHENGVWNLTIPEGMGGDQWQGQFPINTKLAASMSKKYNLYLVLEADNDCPGVTIKLTESDDADGTKHDDNFFCADRHKVEAGTPFIFKANEVSLPKQDAHALSLFFDFGGTPVGTNIKISEIYFEEVKEVLYTDEKNQWKSVDAGDNFISVTPWFSPADWSGGLEPTWSHENGKAEWSLTIPEGMGGDQWMGQFPINTKLTASKDKTYSFSVTLEADNDCPGVTIKLTESDDADGTKHDDNFFFADRHKVTAFEDYTYTVTGAQIAKQDAHALSLFFDFGGTPVGTNIKIKNITFIEE